MNEKEIAYRNGYAKGYQDAKKEERHGKWDIFDDGYGCELMSCSVCKAEFYDGDNDTVDHPHNYCPNCGAIMDLPNITEQTENALRKLGEQTHGDN